VRARERPVRGNFIGWALASALALTTHYFAVFLVVPEAVSLIARGGNRRAAAAASAAVGAAGVALAPLALAQHAHGFADWITLQPLWARARGVATLFVAGSESVGLHPSWVVAGLALGLAIALLFRQTD